VIVVVSVPFAGITLAKSPVIANRNSSTTLTTDKSPRFPSDIAQPQLTSIPRAYAEPTAMHSNPHVATENATEVRDPKTQKETDVYSINVTTVNAPSTTTELGSISYSPTATENLSTLPK